MDPYALYNAIADTLAVIVISTPITVVLYMMYDCLAESIQEEK